MSESADKSPAAAAPTKVKPKRKRSSKRKVRKLPPYNVVLLDDDDHTFDYVIEMLKALFGHPEERGMLMAEEVNSTGRVIVFTTHREHAELKRDQIHGYGADIRSAGCKGSMSAIVEPAQTPSS
jgi:ATP-dependent Clp protease adaptor protein ClpS